MIDNFHLFSTAVAARFADLSRHELFIVDVEDIFASYLAAFPEGSNPIFRERTEHDCSCCKHFVRTLGPVVAIINGQVETVWDVDVPHPYNVVASALGDLLRQAPIRTVFRTKFRQFGNEYTLEGLQDGTRRWNHFVGRVVDKHYATEPDAARGRLETRAQVLERGLKELKLAAVEEVLDLVNAGALYRGEEHKAAIEGFRNLLTKYDGSKAFVWANIDDRSAGFKNTVVGTLVEDISNGVELERAVKSFETKVAPQNYKRPTALITPKMVEAAVSTLRALGLEQAVERRFAKIQDVSVNNVHFVDNAVRGQMKGGIEGLLMDAAKPKKVNLDRTTTIAASEFLDRIVPGAQSIQLLLDNRHLSNFVSLTAPVHENTGKLFKWDNDFAWSYDGEVTDSIKERVKRAGGNVSAPLRFSLSWSNYDDLDLHVLEPNGNNIFYASKRGHYGHLDVDMNAGSGATRSPVENTVFQNPPDGSYRVRVHQFARRETIDVGFDFELEFMGQVSQFNYPKALMDRVFVDVMTLQIRSGAIVKMDLGAGLSGGSIPTEKWGLTTGGLVPVDTLMFSPNHWDGQGVGNRHWFFMLKGCHNPNPVRGIYNEFLRPSLDEHRKVFEVLGSKTKCPPTDDQLSGVGFSSARGDKVVAVVNDHQAYEIAF
jgi:hypothetical protein